MKRILALSVMLFGFHQAHAANVSYNCTTTFGTVVHAKFEGNKITLMNPHLKNASGKTDGKLYGGKYYYRSSTGVVAIVPDSLFATGKGRITYFKPVGKSTGTMYVYYTCGG